MPEDSEKLKRVAARLLLKKEAREVTPLLRYVSYIVVIYWIASAFFNSLSYPYSILEAIGKAIIGIIAIGCGYICAFWAFQIGKSVNGAYTTGLVFGPIGLVGYWIYYVFRMDNNERINKGKAKMDNNERINKGKAKMDNNERINKGKAKMDNNERINKGKAKMDNNERINKGKAKLIKALLTFILLVIIVKSSTIVWAILWAILIFPLLLVAYLFLVSGIVEIVAGDDVKKRKQTGMLMWVAFMVISIPIILISASFLDLLAFHVLIGLECFSVVMLFYIYFDLPKKVQIKDGWDVMDDILDDHLTKK
jgi:hypothetical protein